MGTLTIDEVRNPPKLERAKKILAVMNSLASGGFATHSAAGAVDEEIKINEFLVPAAGLAMSLPDGSVAGQRVYLVISTLADSGTMVLTPNALTGGTTLTMNTVNQTAELRWDGTSSWDVMPGSDGVVA